MSFWLAVLAASALVAGCGGARREPAPARPDVAAQAKTSVTPTIYPTPVTVSREENPFGGHLTLGEYLYRLLRDQYFPYDQLYKPPPASFERLYYIEIKQEPAVLHLARDVTAFSADSEGAAAGLENGYIYVWSDWPCSGVVMPEVEPVTSLAWSSASPYLAACGDKPGVVYLFDIQRCGRIAVMDIKSKISRMAVSPRGSWIAACDDGRRLWIGPIFGPVRVAATLKNETLDMAFSPQEGVLMAVDSEGWLTLWATHAGNLLDHIRIKGGPFTEAGFKGRYLLLTAEDGQTLAFDVVRQVAVSAQARPDRFYLDDGVLYYRSDMQRYVKNVHLGRASLAAWFSFAKQAVRVQDVDGQHRFYSYPEGTAMDFTAADDWQIMDVSPDGSFTIRGVQFRLADVIYQNGHDRLLCRRLPGDSFFLWWRKTDKQARFNPHPGALPVREGIRADAPVRWRVLEEQNPS